MGRFRLATGAGSFTSQINGRLGALTLKTDFHEIRLLVNGGANGQIGPVTINGSIIGGSGNDSGYINAEHSIGPVIVKGDILGSTGNLSGAIQAGAGGITSVTIFVNLDVDTYASTRDSLEFFYPRLLPGGILMSHDYAQAEGVREAFDEVLRSKPESIIELPESQCMFIKHG